MFRATCQPVEARRSPSSRLCPIPSLLVGEEWKMLCPAVVFWEALWQARNVPGPSYPARKSVQQWRPAARAHVHRPLGGLTEGMISRRGALISLLWHAQNRFAGGSGERKGRCENRSLEKSHSSVWPVEVLDYFKHANQSRRCCTLQTDGWTGVRDQRIVEERPEPFHRRRSQPTAGSHTYCCTHTHFLMPGTRRPLIHEGLSGRALCLLACRPLGQQGPGCSSRKLNWLDAGPRSASLSLICLRWRLWSVDGVPGVAIKEDLVEFQPYPLNDCSQDFYSL